MKSSTTLPLSVFLYAARTGVALPFWTRLSVSSMSLAYLIFSAAAFFLADSSCAYAS